MDSRYLKNLEMFLVIHKNKTSEEKRNEIKILIEEGADVNALDGNDNDNTPLHKAVKNLELCIVNTLLNSGADAMIRNRNGSTPIELAKSLSKTPDTEAIIETLKVHLKSTTVQKHHDQLEPIDNDEQDLSYVKRPGTTGIGGQLFETKLISLFLFRLLNNNNIVNFYIGTNIQGIGALDDICIKLQIHGDERPKILFIQAKHKESTDKAKLSVAELVNRNSDFGLVKNYESYLQVRHMFEKNRVAKIEAEKNQFEKNKVKKNEVKKNKVDVMFKDSFTNVDCFLILLTPIKNDIPKKYKKYDSPCGPVRKFISTGGDNDDIFQINDINLLMELYIENEIESLGEELNKTLLENNDLNYTKMMQNPLIKKFHLVIAQSVVNVCAEKFDVETNTKYRDSNFRMTFLKTNDKLLTLLKNKIFENVSDIEKSKYQGESYTFKLPHTFGNVDLVVTKEKRIKWLASKFVELFEKYKETKEIIIDENFCENNNIQKGFLEIGGGIESLLGNLLILDEETKKIQFNVDIKTSTQSELQTNAEKLLVELKNKTENVYDIYSYRFHIQLNDYTRFSFKGDLQDKILAQEFLDNLWFFTNQAKQKQVEHVLKAEIKLNSQKVALLRIQSDAIFFKFHDEVQKWWMDTDVNYLNPHCKFYETSKNYGLDSPVLTVLHDFYTKKLKKVLVNFNEEAIKSLGLNEFLNETHEKFITIATKASFLTMIKINQYFQENDSNGVVFLDLEFIVKAEYYEQMQSELDSSKSNVFIIIHKNNDYEKELSESLNKISKSGKKIILVFEKDSNIISQMNKGTSKVDKKLNLIDVYNNNSLLNQWCVSFQDRDTSLDKILDEESKHLITSDILSKLINREKVEIGKPIVHPRFEEVKEYYVHRNLYRGEEYSIKNLNDVNDSVVIVVAEPGMGKSTLLSQLSINTKDYDESKFNRSPWIVYINLLDYSSEFMKFKNVEFDLNEAIRFLCKAAVKSLPTEKTPQNIKRNQIKSTAFKILTDGDYVAIKNLNLESATALELNLFAHYYNQRNIKFVFDGYDEICPRYEKEVVRLLKLLTCNWHKSNCKIIVPSTSTAFLSQTFASCDCKVDDHNQFRLWISTRSYNNVKNNLERELGRSAYTVNPLSRNQQLMYLFNYFGIHFKMSDCTKEIVANIKELFNYVSVILSDERTHVNKKALDVPLYAVYLTAVEYFKNELQIDEINAALNTALESYDEHFENRMNFIQSNSISGIPLYLYIAAEYFHDQVKSEMDSKWDVNIKSFKLFESFLDKKFRDIYYEEKRKGDISNPYNEYQKDLQDFVEKHKKMALFAIFDSADLLKLLSENDLTEIIHLIKRVDDGEEKTGIVDKVVDNIPRFIHLVFAEYYAIEYICDLLKQTINEKNDEKLKTIWDFIITIVFYKNVGGAKTFFDHKLNNDEEFFDLIRTETCKSIVFELLLKQGRENRVTPQGFNNSFQALKSSLNVVVEERLLNIENYFLTCIQSGLNAENLEEFIRFISDSLVLFVALGTSNVNFMERIRACVARVNHGNDRLLNLILPHFASSILPLSFLNQNPVAFLKMLTPVASAIPQLRNINLNDLTMLESVRGVILEYVKLFWDLITDSYLPP